MQSWEINYIGEVCTSI